MPGLMILAPAPSDDAPTTRLGGRPLALPGTAWPSCKSCKKPLQFIAQLALSELGRGDGLLVVFQCQNDPGLCDDWDANAGGNLALLVPTTGLALLAPPPDGRTLLPQSDGVAVEPFEGAYEAARDAWAKRTGRAGREVLGYAGGTPSWIQGDETPACQGCGQPMSFVALLEEGLSRKGGTLFNFGGGAAYAFACSPCTSAKFLWQQ